MWSRFIRNEIYGQVVGFNVSPYQPSSASGNIHPSTSHYYSPTSDCENALHCPISTIDASSWWKRWNLQPSLRALASRHAPHAQSCRPGPPRWTMDDGQTRSAKEQMNDNLQSFQVAVVPTVVPGTPGGGRRDMESRSLRRGHG
jgi:hypothetical protein